MFLRFINEFNDTKVPVRKFDDLKIEEEFDNYTECDYWGFTLMATKSGYSKKELYVALESNFALYNCDDMVEFVKYAGKVDFVIQNESVILETLQKNTDSCVKRILTYAIKLRPKAK